MDYEREDAIASRWGNAAVALTGCNPTIEEICRAAGEPMPVSEDDLHYLRIKCRNWGIACNMGGELAWEGAK